VRILSYNIHKGIGGRDRRYRIERIIEVIEREQPDVICLQEVTHRVRKMRYHDQALLLRKHFAHADHLYQMNVRYKDGVSGYGNLLLSRWPLAETHQISIRCRTKKPRGAQIAVVDSPGGRFRLVHWHLGLAEGERRWQVEHLLAHRAYRAGDGLPTAIVGDFNDWRNALGRGPLLQSGFVQATAPISRFRTFPAWMPIGSLDKAFHSPELRVERVHVVKTHLSRRASDHLPLTIDFALRGDDS
jgi:endonuclease/exonuclease/phosphatase family metal-dependent hydrolase